MSFQFIPALLLLNELVVFEPILKMLLNFGEKVREHSAYLRKQL